MTIRDVRPRFDLAKFNEYLYQKAIPESRLDGFNSAGVWRHQNKKGDIVYAEITGHEIRYDNQRCRVIIANDVTEKVLQQEEMKRREQFLTSLIDSQTNFLLRVNSEGVLTFANKQLLKVLGYKKSELVGKHFSSITQPEDAQLSEQAFKSCIKNPGKVVTLQCHNLDKGGNVHRTKWEFISIINETGLVTEIQGVGQDITHNTEIEKEAIKAADEVAWTKNNLEALINNTEDLTWSIDRDGKYVYMNTAYRKRITDSTGKAPKEGDDAYIHSGSTDQVRDEWRSYYKRALSGERYVTQHDSPDPVTGQMCHFEVSFNPIHRDAKNEIIGVGCFARDVTDILNKEAALIDQNERLRNIASLSSHELRRPVASMLGLMNIMDRENFTNPDNAQIIEHMFTVTKEIDDVIHQIVNNTFIGDKFSL
jgi:PAS domain S-box-containing protein